MSQTFQSDASASTRYTLRTDGDLFDDEYLQTGNRETAEKYLWPVPVFERHRDDLQSETARGCLEIRPGDILEYCGGAYEEYLLVVTILPEPEPQWTEIEQSDQLLCYSSNAETYRVFPSNGFIKQPNPDGEDHKLDHPTGEYVLHRNAASLVPVGGCAPTDITYPPRPHVGKNGYPENKTKSNFAFQHPLDGVQVSTTKPSDEEPIDTFLNKITHGDAADTLSRLPANACHAFITSPPYYNVRDYGTTDQLGQEPTVDEYITNLLEVVSQLLRVLRKDGLGILVINDVYSDGSLQGIPHRIHRELVRLGFEIIHHAPWTKPNPCPDPAPNRYSNAHEHILIIAHEGGNHYFNKHAADDPRDVFDIQVGQTDTDHDAVFPVELPRQLIKTTVLEQTCPTCGNPYEPTYEVTDIRNLDTERPQAKRALELADKHDLTDEHLEAVRSVGLSHTGQAKRTQDGTGKNDTEVEQLAEEAADALGSYTREFTNPKKEHTGFTQSCDCSPPSDNPDSGIVIDPFMGSGTTAIAAKQLQRNWIGIELNEDYIATAQARIGTDVDNPEKLTDENQDTLDSFF